MQKGDDNIGNRLNSGVQVLTNELTQRLNSINDLISKLNTFGETVIDDANHQVNELVTKNLAIIDDIVDVTKLAGINRDHCMNRVAEIKSLPNVLSQELLKCANDLRNNGRNQLESAVNNLQNTNNQIPWIKNNIETCKNNGYPIDCALPIYVNIANRIFEVNSIEVEQSKLVSQGNAEFNLCSIKAIQAVKNKVTGTANCLLS